MRRVTSPWRISDRMAREKLYNLFMENITWTTEYPTRPGVYWVRNILWDRTKSTDLKPDPELRIAQFLPSPFTPDLGLDFYLPGNERTFCQGLVAAAQWFGPLQPPNIEFCKCGKHRYNYSRNDLDWLIHKECGLPVECDFGHLDVPEDEHDITKGDHPANTVHIDYVVCWRHEPIAVDNVHGRTMP